MRTYRHRMPSGFGAKFRELRQNTGVTIDEVAEHIGATRHMVTSMEVGYGKVTIEERAAMLELVALWEKGKNPVGAQREKVLKEARKSLKASIKRLQPSHAALARFLALSYPTIEAFLNGESIRRASEESLLKGIHGLEAAETLSSPPSDAEKPPGSARSRR